MKVGFIGGGNMGEAMLSAMLAKGLASGADVMVSDVAPARREYLAKKHGVGVTSDNREALQWGDVVILAVKPQQLNEVMVGLSGGLKAEQLVLSIIAGVRMETLRGGLNHSRIVRVMPNTPAQVGEGMSVWVAAPEVSGEQQARAASILGVMGKEIRIDDEQYIDMATAVSGSGPAYIFLLAEAMIAAAEHLGFSPEVAHELVLQTVFGSASFMLQSDKTPAELRKMVTSPGGTTAAALACLEQGQFNELMKQAIKAACDRAKELGA